MINNAWLHCLTFNYCFSSRLTIRAQLLSPLYSLPELQGMENAVLCNVLICVRLDFAKVKLSWFWTLSWCMNHKSFESFLISFWRKGDKPWQFSWSFYSTILLLYSETDAILCLQGSCYSVGYVWCWSYPVGMCLRYHFWFLLDPFSLHRMDGGNWS